MATLANLSASDLRRAADIKEQIEKLTSQLAACLGGGYTGDGFVPARVHWTKTPAGRAKMAKLMKAQWKTRKPGRQLGKSKAGRTVADCILKALGNETLPIRKILIRASQIRGKAISPMMMSFTLAQMKKRKQVLSPERGQYRRA